MSVTVKFKSDEECPCPNGEPEAWAACRGQQVRIGQPVPTDRIAASVLCGSDTYWQVESGELVQETARILGDPEEWPAVACRHILEMGD